MSNSRFKYGSGLYECWSCGKRTRETGQGESDVQMCAYCYEVAGAENSYADGIIDDAQYRMVLAAISKEYGRTDHQEV